MTGETSECITAPVEGGDGNHVSGANSEASEGAGEGEDAVNELLACLVPVPVGSHWGAPPQCGYPIEALAHVRFREATHFDCGRLDQISNQHRGEGEEKEKR